MKYWLGLAFLILPKIVYCQLSSNQELLTEEKRNFILNLAEYNKKQDSIFNYQFDTTDRLDVYLLPTVGIKERQNYSYNQDLMEYLDFSNIDTLAEAFLYRKDGLQVVAILSSPTPGEYILSPPLLKEDRKFKKLTKRYELGRVFVFKLPFFSEWWIMDEENLMVMNPKNGRITKSKKYIKQNYDQQDFSNLLKGIILIDEADRAIKTLQMIDDNN